jgi:hypothetical protein
MRVSLKSLVAAGVLATITSAASAATINTTSTVSQAGILVPQTGGSYQLTDPATPYDFTGQVNSFANVDTINSITVTVTSILDGDSGPGDYDENNLHLGLDGIDTGLVLNGLNNNAIVTLTLSQPNPALQAALIAALADGKLVGTIIDTDADVVAGDIIGIPALDTTLELTLTGRLLQGPGGGGGNPVPLPAAVLIAPLGAGLAGMYSRRFRRAK